MNIHNYYRQPLFMPLTLTSIFPQMLILHIYYRYITSGYLTNPSAQLIRNCPIGQIQSLQKPRKTIIFKRNTIL
jgi:hypothetical protein